MEKDSGFGFAPTRLGGPKEEKAKNKRKSKREDADAKAAKQEAVAKAADDIDEATPAAPGMVVAPVPAPNPTTAFLHDAHDAACQIFGTTLGPRPTTPTATISTWTWPERKVQENLRLTLLKRGACAAAARRGMVPEPVELASSSSPYIARHARPHPGPSHCTDRCPIRRGLPAYAPETHEAGAVDSAACRRKHPLGRRSHLAAVRARGLGAARAGRLDAWRRAAVGRSRGRSGARRRRALGIPAIALFPYTDPQLRTADAGEAFNPENLVCRAARAL